MTDGELARSAALAAAALLRDLRRSATATGAELGALGDRAANELILAQLRAVRPDDMILSEEAADDRSRCAKRRVWVVDPLDGTREYSQGRDDYAVHVALTIDGIAQIGAVALPAFDLVFSTDMPAPLPVCADPLRMLVSRSRPAPVAASVAEMIGATLVPMGSAGAKAMAILRGDGNIYLHSGGQYEWDSCAPVAVARAAGLFCSRIDGSPLTYNCEDVSLPDLLICRKEHADMLLHAVRECGAP